MVSLTQEILRLDPTFLIIDVEGAEHDLLMGADLHNIETIVLELHEDLIGLDKSIDIRRRLASQGFSVNERLSIHNSATRWNLLFEGVLPTAVPIRSVANSKASSPFVHSSSPARM